MEKNLWMGTIPYSVSGYYSLFHDIQLET